jgi:uncharacterized protein (TIGR00266 family)
LKSSILHPGSNAVVHVELQPGDKIMAEAGSLMARSPDLRVVGKMWGGAFGAMKRKLLGGETFFFQEITTAVAGSEVLLSPKIPGDIKVIEVDHGEDFFVRSGCLLAAFDDVEMDTKAQKLGAGLFSGTGFFALHLKGRGQIVISSFGAIMEIPIPAGEQSIIDNGHLVAWSGDTPYKIVKSASTWGSSFTTGGGFACQFEGPGRVWVQTRNPKLFAVWLSAFIPGKSPLLALFG